MHQNAIISVEENEYVVGVAGRTGAIFDSLSFITSRKRLFNFGGEGAEYFEYLLRDGYHMGAASIHLNNYLAGFQFDYKKIPRAGIKMNKPQAAQFFEDCFEKIIEFLSCADVLRLFRVSKSTSARRLISERFWVKCLSLGDALIVAYF